VKSFLFWSFLEIVNNFKKNLTEYCGNVTILSYEIKHITGKFFIRLGSGKYSYLKYHIKNGNFEITSTFSPEDHRGKGLAAVLVEKAVNYANKKNLHVIPKCSYAKDYLSKKTYKKNSYYLFFRNIESFNIRASKRHSNF